ncbi:MAG TPA: methionine--tRNA ligase subunit beta [Candidatus Paceibacterota bacterium]
MITIDDFKKTEIRVGRIMSAERVEGSEKLVKFQVSFGGLGERQIIAGVGLFFKDVLELVDRKVAFAFNLEPRTLMGLESQGMVLGVGDGEAFSLLSVDASVPEGSLVR